MDKKNLGAGHTGFHDWYRQRISAVVLLLFLPVLAVLLWKVVNGTLDFVTLNQWLTSPLGKSLSTLFLLAMLMHIWTGLKVIFEDYIHTSSGRMIILNILLLGLITAGIYMGYHIWAEAGYTISCVACSKGEVSS